MRRAPWLLRVARTVGVAWLASFVALFALQRRIVFSAPSPVPVVVPRGATLLSVATPAGWNATALRWPAPPGAATIVHFHGNGEQLAWQVDLGEALHAAGYGVVAAEYPGYGTMSAIAPTERSLDEAAEALLRHLEGPLHVPPERVILQGFSLGTGVASAMARRGLGGRLVLIAPYTSMRDMGALRAPWLPARWMIRDPFDTASRAPLIHVPTLLMHGDEDDVVPTSMSAVLARRFPDARRVLLRGTRHNDVFARSMIEVVEALRGFAPP